MVWNRIDTAPKDGNEVKLYVSGDDHDAPPFQCVAAWSRKHKCWLVMGDYTVEEDGAVATHWAPLDPAPEPVS